VEESLTCWTAVGLRVGSCSDVRWNSSLQPALHVLLSGRSSSFTSRLLLLVADCDDDDDDDEVEDGRVLVAVGDADPRPPLLLALPPLLAVAATSSLDSLHVKFNTGTLVAWRSG